MKKLVNIYLFTKKYLVYFCKNDKNILVYLNLLFL